MVGYKKNITLALLIALSVLPAHAEWVWLSSLKTIATPLLHKAAQYPKITAALTILSLVSIGTLQMAINSYFNHKSAANNLAQEEKNCARALNVNASLMSQQNDKKTFLEPYKASLRAVTNTIDLNQEKLVEGKQEKRNQELLKQRHLIAPWEFTHEDRIEAKRLATIQEENRPDLPKEIEKTKHFEAVHNTKRATLKNLEEECAVLQSNPARETERKILADVLQRIKDKPKTDVNLVLQEAQTMLEAPLRKQCMKLKCKRKKSCICANSLQASWNVPKPIRLVILSKNITINLKAYVWMKIAISIHTWDSLQSKRLWLTAHSSKRH